MNSAIAYASLGFAAIYAVVRSRSAPELKDLVLAVTLVWPIAAALAPDLLEVRNEVIIALGGMGIIWHLASRSQAWIPGRRVSLVTFLCYLAISPLWALNPLDAGMRTIGVLLMLAFVFSQVTTRKPMPCLRLVYDTMVVVSYTGTAILIIGAFQQGISLGQRFEVSVEARATGTAVLCLGCLVFLVAKHSSEHGIRRPCLLALAGTVCVMLLLTGTRGAALSMLLIFPLLLEMYDRPGRRNPVTKQAIAITLLCAALLAIWTFVGTGTRQELAELFRYSSDQGFDDSRSQRWLTAIDRARDRFLLGRGMGSSTFTLYSDLEFVGVSSSRALTTRMTVHSQFVETYYDHGIIGLVLFLWVVGDISLRGWAIFRRPPIGLELQARALVVFWFCEVLGMVFHGGCLTTGNPYHLAGWTAGAVVAAVGGVHGATATPRQRV